MAKTFKDRLKELGFAYVFKEAWFRIFSDRPNYYSVNSFLLSCLKERPVDIPDFKNLDDDKKVVNILRWVKANIEYVSDNSQRKGNIRNTEYWQTPFETVYLRTGDCEDMSILIFCLCRWNRVNPLKIRFVCGDVKITGGSSGHAWTEYLADYDMNWYVLDAAYYYDGYHIPERLSIIFNSVKNLYLKTWFKVSI